MYDFGKELNKLDGVAQLIVDPSRCNYTSWQNQPIQKNAVTFELMKHFLCPFRFRMS